jgi:hypothetical protein
MANHGTIKISADFLQEARDEAETTLRSVGAQVEYWARLGRALEAAPGFTAERAREALSARRRLEALPVEQQARVLDDLGASFDQPDDAVRVYYAKLGAREGAAGSDGKGGVIRRQPARQRRRA